MTAAPEDPDRARPAASRHRSLPPPVVAGAAAVVQGVLARGAGSTSSSRAAAGGLVVGALMLMGASAATLHRERTTISPHDLSGATTLVRAGPFGRSRNPIYLGIAGLLLARAVDRRSWAALLPVGLFVLVMDRTQIPAEEEALRSRFGAEYEEYLRAVPRWWGRGWRTRRGGQGRPVSCPSSAAAAAKKTS
ncbi:methyltransferase family protein [Brachybacterium vulturis]|nr:isoprenylcysteine carboxylmethyltransferase family protein [Brachybacterium vulturis]